MPMSVVGFRRSLNPTYRAAKLDAVDVDGLIQYPEEALPVGIVFVDVFALIAAASDVVYGAFVLDGQKAGHVEDMGQKQGYL
jgi:hypothetical protein